jgi:neutral ceramidase
LGKKEKIMMGSLQLSAGAAISAGASISAGAAVVDITPPLAVGLLTSSVKGEYAPFESVRLPLKARVLVLRSADETVAIVSMDLLALNDTSVGGWTEFKKGISDDLPPEKIIITCTHTHSAPESVALSGLYLTEEYKTWLTKVQKEIKEGITQAVRSALPCTVVFSTARLNGYSLQRRIPTAEGIIMSDSQHPVPAGWMSRGPVDRRVRTVRLVGLDGDIIATLVHAICHPVHEMCLPHISSEFPGEMCLALEAAGTYGVPLFLNGAAGDTNPPTVSSGPLYARQHGQALAGIAAKRNGEIAADTGIFKFARQEIQFSSRGAAGVPNQRDALARISAVRIGALAIVFLPGEPFVETAQVIEAASPFDHTIVVGFGENNIGYIPTEKAFDQGGYEVGPGKWSFLEKGADKVLSSAALKILEELL